MLVKYVGKFGVRIYFANIRFTTSPLSDIEELDVGASFPAKALDSRLKLLV